MTDITLFLRQLGTLSQAGIPILQCFEILYRHQTNIALQNMILAIKIDIEKGLPLLQSLKHYPQYFDKLSTELIHIGLHTGTFSEMLLRVALHKEKIILLYKKIKQALLYPAIITSVAIIVTILMLTFVVPRFEELFNHLQGTLPLFTRIVIYISYCIRQYGIAFFIPVIAFGLFKDILKNSLRIQFLMLHLPYISPYLRKAKVLHFSRNLATTLAAGIPIIDALKLIAESTGSIIYRDAILTLDADIMQGHTLHQAMQKNSLFPNLLAQMIKIGEESGNLEQMLDKIADIYESEIDYFVTNLSHLLEPLIMIVLGVLISGLVIAMYLPIFKLGTLL